MKKLSLILIVLILTIFMNFDSIQSEISVKFSIQQSTEPDITNLILRNELNNSFSDSTGNGHDITNSGCSWNTTSVSSSFNTSLYCDDGNYDGFTIADHNDLTFTNGTDGEDVAFSFDFWLHPVNPAADPAVVFRKANEYKIVWSKFVNQLEVYLYSAGAESAWIGQASGQSVPSANTWGHITVTYNGNKTKEGIEIYEDGVIMVSPNRFSNGAYLGMSNTTNWLAGGISGVGTGFDGYFDEIRLWNTTLNGTEALWLYENAPDIPEEALPETTTTTITTEEALPPDFEYSPIIIAGRGFSPIEIGLILGFIVTGSALGFLTIRSFRKGKK